MDNSLLSSTRIPKSIIGKRGTSKTSSGTKKEVSGVSTKDSVVGLSSVVVPVPVPAGVKDLVGDILTSNSSSSPGKASIQGSVASEESCVGIIVSGANTWPVLWF